ncbi:MAG: uroporphyrinogen decarboxylase family protein [Kiritimatiellaeota bacterium]|nr:uroporphyrinogen decarboxylase family protein [Kiritimatiellota bacterium]
MQRADGRGRCLEALKGNAAGRVPVFPLLMSFAAERHGLTYRQFASDGAALAEAQLSAMERFGLDAVTACSDAFRLSADYGGDIVFPETTPPFLATPLIRSEADVARLGTPDPTAGRMGDRVNAARALAKGAGERALAFGWVDMPFAEACSACGLGEFMLWLCDAPALAHRLLEKITGDVIRFALAQLEAGCLAIGAGDAAASLVSPEMYRAFALPYERQVIRAIHDAKGLVKLHICGNTTALMDDMLAADADLYNVDHLVDFDTARTTYGKAGKAFKGNIDPVEDMLRATPEHCRAKSLACLAAAHGLPYMLSPGCEVPAATPDAVMHAFCSAP